jgi:hypothetical protein
MTPTPKLRWAERSQPIYPGADTGHIIRVLQQWHAYDVNYPTEKGEWKDVPVVKDTDS